jgi:hypothetical protein
MNVMIAYMNVTQMRLVIRLGPEHVLGRTQSVVTFASYAVLRATVLTFTGILAVLAIYGSVSRDLRAPLRPAGEG